MSREGNLCGWADLGRVGEPRQRRRLRRVGRRTSTRVMPYILGVTCITQLGILSLAFRGTMPSRRGYGA